MGALPKPSARFRPRADAPVLREALDVAWQAKIDELAAQRAAANVGEVVAAHLEKLFPAHDMTVLSRYGLAQEIQYLAVRVYNPKACQWDQVVRVELPHCVTVPAGPCNVYACGPRSSREPNRGVTATYRAELEAEGGWEAFCAHQETREARQLPAAVEPYFVEAVGAINAYHVEYRRAAEWPRAVKAKRGQYPTWQEIADKFPVLGAHIERLRGQESNAQRATK